MAIKITRAADVGFGDKVPAAIPEYVKPPVVAGFVDTGQKTQAISQGLSDLGATLSRITKENREKARLAQAKEENSKAAVNLIEIQAQLNRSTKAISSDMSLSPKEKSDQRDRLVGESKEEYQNLIPKKLQVQYDAPFAASTARNMAEFSNTMVAQADDRYRGDTAKILAQGVTVSGEDPSKIEEMRSIVHNRIDITPIKPEARVVMKATYDRDVDLNYLRQRSAEVGGATELLQDLKEKGKKGAYKNFKGITIKDREDYISEAESAAITDTAMTSSSDVWDKFAPEGDIAPVDRGLMMDELEKMIKDPETLKEARSFLLADINDHNADVAARTKANLSAVFEASDKGGAIVDIRSMPEYVALPGDQKRAAMSLMIGDKARANKAVDEEASANAWFYFSLKTTQELKDMSVIEYHKEWSKMSPGNRSKAETAWKSAHKKGGGEVGVISLKTLPSHRWQTWRLGKPSEKQNAEVFNAFTVDYDAEIRAFQTSKGRKPTIDEAYAMADNIMASKILAVIDEGGWFSDAVTKLPSELGVDDEVKGIRYTKDAAYTQPESGKKRIVKTATMPDGRKVIQYEDGSQAFAK